MIPELHQNVCTCFCALVWKYGPLRDPPQLHGIRELASTRIECDRQRSCLAVALLWHDDLTVQLHCSCFIVVGAVIQANNVSIVTELVGLSKVGKRRSFPILVMGHLAKLA